MNDYRISKLRLYLFTILDNLMKDAKYQINADMLSDNIDNFSLDKIPQASVVEGWIIGPRICTDVFSFRSRKAYSQDVINNLNNIGFFEQFEKIIFEKNKKGELPDIDGIESIECLNPGTLNNVETGTAEFDIQIKIQYREVDDECLKQEKISL